MVEVTKKQRYTPELIRGLLENRAFLNDLDDIHTTTATLPIIDFKIAVERCEFTASEQRILDTVYTDDVRIYNDSVAYWAKHSGVSTRSIYLLCEQVIAKVDAEMNRGLAHV
ncbi:hypothetical protein [Macrococcus capreoli]|uniref:hypothetical protein n=1 Tax=Macrococcus capreoli TaxID=2982690 RepID=UPI0021D608D3|nr:hypothetical protein [Macrococcus sp. TMW 2.2395]MCU7556554.1 hypothetical protein [Macrococcus sp. TMW 2.2395]